VNTNGSFKLEKRVSKDIFSRACHFVLNSQITILTKKEATLGANMASRASGARRLAPP